MNIKSPLTLSTNTIKVYEFDNKKIIKSYEELGLDVSQYIEGSVIELWQCNDTGYRFYVPFTVFGDGSFYENLQEKLPQYYKAEKFEYSFCLKYIRPELSVLEVGCGSGFFLQKCMEKGSTVIGLEQNQKAIDEGRAKNILIYNKTLQEFASTLKIKFDVVCFFQVLEHITEVRSFMNAALDCLKPGGLLMIAVPNNNPFIFKNDIYHALNLPPHHAGLWNKATFHRLNRQFPIQLENLVLEPLTEYKTWFEAQKNYFKAKGALSGSLLSLIPRPLYKLALRAFQSKIEGKNIIAVYKKT